MWKTDYIIDSYSFLRIVKFRIFYFHLFLWFMFSIYGREDIYDDLPRHQMVISDNSTEDSRQYKGSVHESQDG